MFLDIFKINKFKRKIKALETENNNISEENNRLNQKLNVKLSLQAMSANDLNNLIHKREKEKNDIETETTLEKDKLKAIMEEIGKKQEALEDLKAEVGDLNSNVEISNYGLYDSNYKFESSWEYKEKLKKIRQKEKDSIKNKTAVHYDPNWRLNGSIAMGKSLIRKNIKAMMRSFNNECTEAIKKVNHSNYYRIENRIIKSCEQHNKMYSLNDLRIEQFYLDYKINELDLAFGYELKKEEEKEQLKEERRKEREEKQLKKDVEKQNKSIDKDIDHYSKAIEELEAREDQTQELKDEIKSLKQKIKDNNDKKDGLNSTLYNAQAGYVYIISNIGSLGKNIVKIGVTRRLKPEDRVRELSSASVPFKFDIHALIFSTDAFALENKLHKRFSKNRVNKINGRKEFFHISIDEIENELKKYDNVTVDFNEIPVADEYRETLKIDNKAAEKQKIDCLLE
ncbi:DUF4041 domain-containing protein [Apilactobacillus quenuiae]|uniref:DUF4041 domain-containing protein n=1 Tax=Apilactobacillus quenuiae TaxID=2008377 RepID=UPI000D014592|nr:DUF4041 domain-containing protein [Apilactobacillus quenuiae]